MAVLSIIKRYLCNLPRGRIEIYYYYGKRRHHPLLPLCVGCVHVIVSTSQELPDRIS